MATNPGDECQGKEEMEIDEPPFIVKVGAKNQLNLDADVLHQVISRFEPPLVVLSVIGRPRSGKSFLLNYILRYLKVNGNGKWFGKPDEPLDGFPWNQGDDNEDREGIRICHENVCIGEEQETSLRLILLDIDFFVEPSCQDSALRYAALESFCLAVSNAVLYVDSSFKAQVDIEAYLNQILDKLHQTPRAVVKYIQYEAAQEQDEPHDTAVPSALLCLNTTTFPAYRYAAVKLHAFKGESKFLSANSNLKDFKSLLINTFPVNELQQLLSTPDSHYQSVDQFLENSKKSLHEINGVISSIPIHKYPVEVQGRPQSILAGEESGQATKPDSVKHSLPVKRVTAAESITQSAEAKKEVLDGNDFQSKLQSTDPGSVKLNDLNEASTTLSTPTSVRIIPSTEIGLKPGVNNPNSISANSQIQSSPEARAQHWIQHHFKEVFHKCLQSNLVYFVRDSTTRATLWSTITEYIVKTLTRNSNDCNHIETNKMAQIYAQELLQLWKPVITGLGYFQSMVENEFDSELFLNHATLKSLFEKAESFATRKFNAGGNKVLNWMFKTCVEACKKNYLEKNKFVQESELKIMQDAVAETVNHFKLDLNLQFPSDSSISLKELQEKRKQLFVNSTAALNKCYTERQEYLPALQILIDTEFYELIRLREKSLQMTKDEYERIVEDRLTSYEEQMRTYFDESPPVALLIAKHEVIKDSAIHIFRRNTTADELTELYESDLLSKIQSSFDARLKQIKLETRSTKVQTAPAEILTQHQIPQYNNIAGSCTIGIHLGRSKIRCSSYRNSKFIQIPLEGQSTVIPSYLGFNFEGKLVIGSDAERLYTYNRPRALKLEDLKIGKDYKVPDDNGNVNCANVSFEVAVGIFLKFICRKSEEFLKSKIELIVVTVPTLSDYTLRRAIAHAAQLADIENIYLVSESSSAIARYIQKYSSHLGDAKDVMVAYQGNQSFIETVYFKVGQQSGNQIAISKKYIERQTAWYSTLLSFLTSFFQNKSETYPQMCKQFTGGKSKKNFDTLLLAADLPNSHICKPNSNSNCKEDIDSTTGVVEGACYYAQSLTSKSSILIQECLPYDLNCEYQEKTLRAFNKFTPLPEEAVLKLKPNPYDSQLQLKLYTRFSNDDDEVSTHTHTISIVTLNILPYDTVEIKLELDTQGLLSIRAFLFDSKSGNRKSVMANIMYTRNLDIIKLKESKDKLEGLYTFLLGT